MNKLKNKFREFGFTSFAVDNGTSIFILALMILVFGIQSYQSMPKEQFPDVKWPTVYVNTPYFGNSAPDIENLVTRPIEKELQSINGIKDIKSTSIQDYSVITAEFVTDMDLDEAVRKVKDAVDKAKGELPNDLDQEPTVLDIDLSEIPIVTINVSGDYSNDELRNFADYLKDKIETIEQVSKVEMKGELEREVKVDVDLLKMESMQVSFRDIENAIASENVTMSGGELVRNDFRRAIRVKGEFETVRELEEMIVKSENQSPILLKDIAQVTFGFKDRTSIARADALPVISLDVIKRQDENLLEASDRIKNIVEEARQSLPEELKISFFNDQSINTRNQVNNLENSIISGVILVVLVLLFFLGIRNALFVGIAIPLSMLMGIMLLYLTGVTLNIVVLFSLILALGLLVDNAIVVVENIYRYMQEGYSGVEAAKYGAGEVALPIIASTATTLAAFVPLAFWPGIMGSFMQYMPITLIIVLASSLFVALVINPVLTSLLMKVDERADERSDRRRKRRNVLIGSGIMLILGLAFHFLNVQWARNLLGVTIVISLLNIFALRPAAFYFQNNMLPVLERWYDRFVRSALRMPVLVFSGTVLLLISAMGLLAWKTPKVIFFPSAEPQYVNVFVEMPLGQDIEATSRTVRTLETRIMDAVEPYDHIVEAVLTQIGENTADPNSPERDPGSSPHKARITVSFVPTEERGGISTFNVMEQIRLAVQGIPGVRITVAKNQDGPATGKPINLEVQGENIDTLLVLSERLINFINRQDIPGIEELQADTKLGKPELIVDIDREAARRYEISTYDIASAIRTAVFGQEASTFKQGEEEFPIFIRLDESYRYDVEDLLNQKITFRSASTGKIIQVPISSVASVRYSSTYSSIKRKNLDRVVTIYSNVLEGYNANEIIAEIDEYMKGYPLPEGFSYEFTGEQQQQEEDMSFLNTAFSIAIFAIFIILVAQFNSIISPFIIILSVVFSTIGVFLGYAFTNMDISVIFTGVGIISLAGIVVNNAIVLIDYIKLLIERRLKDRDLESELDLDPEDVREAIVQGGAIRLRPVLLTAITTVLGLIPLAIGFNFNFFTFIKNLDPNIFIGGDNTAIWGPMAWTVIYGLIFATFLTLVVVPVMYWLGYSIKRWAVSTFRLEKPAESRTVTGG
ncbi:MAG: efflux RND transporter permease subunit [Saprospiraceae bacterium]|nr:efflux RND transporter permease subunit [Saprospiraceae bacterium]